MCYHSSGNNMNQQWKRLLYYILINVFVSACTTITVLLIWGNVVKPFPETQKNPVSKTDSSRQIAPTVLSTGTATSGNKGSQPGKATNTPGIVGDDSILIANIIGVGNANDEYVVIKRSGEGELSLEGWQLEDSNRNIYTFPKLTLYKDGVVQVHTKAGVNSVIDLYWGSDQSIWQIGEVATLLDDQGHVRATFRIP
jgi:hypothetical protein